MIANYLVHDAFFFFFFYNGTMDRASNADLTETFQQIFVPSRSV